MTHLIQHVRNERGIAFPLAGIGILAVLSYGIVTLEIGQIGIVKSEMQNVADAAAIAGAQAVRYNRNVDTDARDTAKANSVSSRTGGHVITDANIVSIQTGNYDPDGGFVANLPPINAVEVVVSEVVDNLGYRAADNSTTSTMGARSVAALRPAGPPPDLPLTVGNCLLPPDGSCFEESCLGDPLVGVTTGPLPQTRWTTLFDGATRANLLAKFPNSATCGAPCNGQGHGLVDVNVGEEISLRGAALDPIVIGCVQRCYIDAGITNVTVPVVPCEMGAVAEVVGHESFEIIQAYDPDGTPNLVLKPRLAPLQTAPSGGSSNTNFAVVLVE